MKIAKLFSLLALLILAGCASGIRMKNAHPPMQPKESFFPRGEFIIDYADEEKLPALTPLSYPYIPWRTIAVAPQRILPGSVVFIPEAYGILLPGGEIHDGFFLAHDLPPSLSGDTLRIVTGPVKGKNPFARAGIPRGTRLTAMTVAEPWYSSIISRYADKIDAHRPKPLYRMVAAEIDALLRETSAIIADPNERLAIYSERAKGTPYEIFLLGEGPHGRFDKDPLMDFTRVDCMTLCEQILAMSLSENFEQMFDTLQKIRYKDGEISFIRRNHYTIADWLPNNSDLLYDATEEIAPELTRPMTKTIDRGKFFRSNGVPDSLLHEFAEPETLTVRYIPAENLPAIKDRLRGGEIVSIVTNMPGIVSAHMGLIIRDNFGNVLFRHGSSDARRRKVIDEYFDDVAERLQRSDSRVGMIFMRLRQVR